MAMATQSDYGGGGVATPVSVQHWSSPAATSSPSSVPFRGRFNFNVHGTGYAASGPGEAPHGMADGDQGSNAGSPVRSQNGSAIRSQSGVSPYRSQGGLVPFGETIAARGPGMTHAPEHDLDMHPPATNPARLGAQQFVREGVPPDSQLAARPSRSGQPRVTLQQLLDQDIQEHFHESTAHKAQDALGWVRSLVGFGPGEKENERGQLSREIAALRVRRTSAAAMLDQLEHAVEQLGNQLDDKVAQRTSLSRSLARRGGFAGCCCDSGDADELVVGDDRKAYAGLVELRPALRTQLTSVSAQLVEREGELAAMRHGMTKLQQRHRLEAEETKHTLGEAQSAKDKKDQMRMKHAAYFSRSRETGVELVFLIWKQVATQHRVRSRLIGRSVTALMKTGLSLYFSAWSELRRKGRDLKQHQQERLMLKAAQTFIGKVSFGTQALLFREWSVLTAAARVDRHAEVRAREAEALVQHGRDQAAHETEQQQQVKISVHGTKKLTSPRNAHASAETVCVCEVVGKRAHTFQTERRRAEHQGVHAGGALWEMVKETQLKEKDTLHFRIHEVESGGALGPVVAEASLAKWMPDGFAGELQLSEPRELGGRVLEATLAVEVAVGAFHWKRQVHAAKVSSSVFVRAYLAMTGRTHDRR